MKGDLRRAISMPPVVLWLGGILLGGALLYLIFSSPADSPAQRNAANNLPVTQSENLRLLQLRDADGNMSFEMSARLITIAGDNVTATADDVSHAVYYEKGNPSLTLSAKKVKLNQQTRDVEATGQVSATGQDGFFVKAERVLWTQRSSELHSPVTVRAGLRGNTFEAPKLSYNIKSGLLRCPEQSRATMGQLSVEAREIVYDSVKGLVRCPQNVTARTKNLEATSAGVTYEIKSGILRCPQTVTAKTSGVSVTSTGVTYETKSGFLRCPKNVNAEADRATMRSGAALINTISHRVQLTRGVKIDVPAGSNLQQLQNLPAQLTLLPQGENMKTRPHYLAAGLFLLASTNIVLAQKPDDKKADEKPAAAKNQQRVDAGDVHITSDKLDYIKASATFVLKGNVVVRQDGEDIVVRSDNAVYNRNSNTASASGNLKVDTRDSTITGLKLNADFDSKHAVISGEVFMRSHGAKDGLPDKEKVKKDATAAVDDLSHKPSNMWCDKIDFNYEIQEALVTGNIKIKQEKTSGTCNQVIFDEENNRAKLIGKVDFVDEDKQRFKCDLMYVWFDTGNIKVDGPFEFVAPKKEDKDPNKNGNKTPPQKKSDFPDDLKVPDNLVAPPDNAGKKDTPASKDSKPDKPAN